MDDHGLLIASENLDRTPIGIEENQFFRLYERQHVGGHCSFRMVEKLQDVWNKRERGAGLMSPGFTALARDLSVRSPRRRYRLALVVVVDYPMLVRVGVEDAPVALLGGQGRRRKSDSHKRESNVPHRSSSCAELMR